MEKLTTILAFIGFLVSLTVKDWLSTLLWLIVIAQDFEIRNLKDRL